MNKYKGLLLGLAVAGTVALTACSSAPKDWRGLSESDIAQWKQAGVSARDAQKWVSDGFDTTNALSWVSQGFTEPTEAKHWAAEKFSAPEAKEWIEGEFTLKQAVQNRNKGLEPIHQQPAEPETETETPMNEVSVDVEALIREEANDAEVNNTPAPVEP